MTKAERLAYFAGFLDGEGHITVYMRNVGPGKSHHAMVVAVSNTVRIPLEMLQEEFGGSICLTGSVPKRKPVWRWSVSARKARAVLETLLPYLVIKRNQALVALAFQKEIRYQKGKPVSATEIQRREGLVVQMRQLNRRGVQKEAVV